MERSEARDLNLHIYNTGRPCKHGHAPERYTNSGMCVACVKANATKFRTSFVKKQVEGKFGVKLTVDVPPQHVAMIQELAAGLMKQQQDAISANIEAECYARNVKHGGQAYADRLRAE